MLNIKCLIFYMLFTNHILAKTPQIYKDIANKYNLDPHHIYTLALNTGVKNIYGQLYPWTWSIKINNYYYQFKNRRDLFEYLRSVNDKTTNIYYGIANIPYDHAISPQALWQSLSVKYQIDYLCKRLKRITLSYRKLQNIIKKVSNETGIESALINAIITQESRYKINAVSKAGAKGLMQIMPLTAKELNLAPQDIFVPYKNIKAGATYIKKLLHSFNGQLDLALAAYNSGPKNVKHYGGIPPFKETKKYVSKVISYYQYYKNNME
ncbi:lytic transglycosylase domain-containing protein [Pasteurella atlantica]|uniref:Lytic transglycosylase domain-containing protein n=2 Tax=Pasteurellaceae TaxID=712 RepID=A0ACC6HL03_9PAST|nr:lytic transglycosylase domain-containing protein [Pasteurella atlantica]MDP8051504.1 lytic transglycosylase domain-containing protein [Pasteurella atlantica]MDP8104917.1 lytic transglycosylase domain-containing protein [Pasteurella atlantica]MDP8148291.1 lytic transglycosylase domain-containing protein [Pasteurella atlantica]